MCVHPYVRSIAPDKMICLTCGTFIEKNGRLNKNNAPLVMPPQVYSFNKFVWERWNPWPNIPFKIAEKYGWYGSVIGMDDYLVMPIFDYNSPVPVSYSARRITDNGGKKYRLPPDRNKVIWQSAKILKPPVLVGEGVADAAWLSEIRNSLALLGNHGELAFPVILVLDGDDKGIEAAFQTLEKHRRRGDFESSAVILPDGKDPTDLTVAQLRAIIKEQTGVRL